MATPGRETEPDPHRDAGADRRVEPDGDSEVSEQETQRCRPVVLHANQRLLVAATSPAVFDQPARGLLCGVLLAGF